MKYKVIYADSVTQLEETVALFLSQGWTLQGGVTVHVGEGRETSRCIWLEPELWAQAMTHE